MKKTTASLFAATAAFGIIAASTGIAFAAESPIGDGAKGNPSIGEPRRVTPQLVSPLPRLPPRSLVPEEPPTPEPSNPRPRSGAAFDAYPRASDAHPQRGTLCSRAGRPLVLGPAVTTHGELTPAEVRLL